MKGVICLSHVAISKPCIFILYLLSDRFTCCTLTRCTNKRSTCTHARRDWIRKHWAEFEWGGGWGEERWSEVVDICKLYPSWKLNTERIECQTGNLPAIDPDPLHSFIAVFRSHSHFIDYFGISMCEFLFAPDCKFMTVSWWLILCVRSSSDRMR